MMLLLLATITSALFISATRSDQYSPELLAENAIKPESLVAEQGFGQEQLPLHLAVAAGDLARVLTLVAQGADLYATDPSGMSPMHIAVLYRRDQIMRAFLENNFDLNRFFNVSGTVLEFAVRNVFDEAPKLVGMGGNINEIFPPSGESYIHRAVASGDFSFAKKLIQLGADLDLPDWSSVTPLQIAVARNKLAMLNLLSAAGAKINTGNLLHLAAKKNSADCLRRLLGRGLAVDGKNDNGDTPIVLAVKEDNTAAAEVLLDFKALLQQRVGGKTLLDIALQNKSNKCLRLLLQRGLKIEGDGEKLMEAAVERDNAEGLEALTDFGVSVSVDRNGGNMLHYSAEKGSLSCIQWLIQRGLDVNSRATYNKERYGPLGHNATPLHEAVWFNHLQAVKLLVSYGACLTCKNADNRTPLDYANIQKYEDIAAYLREHMCQ